MKFTSGGHLAPGSKQMPPFTSGGHMTQSHQHPPFGSETPVKGNALAMARKSKPNSKAPVGSGARFEALKNKLANRPGVTNPAALAASIGRKKYGASRMAKMAAKGR